MPAPHADGVGPLDCIARIVPQLRELSIDTYLVGDDEDPPFLSPGAGLPPGVTSLHITGLAEGLEAAFPQLQHLTWEPLAEEPWAEIPEEAVQGLRQFYEDEEEYELVMHSLLPDALARLSRLTYLCLAGHDMPSCPATLAYLPPLAELDLGFNEGLLELPHGPWPALKDLQAVWDGRLVCIEQPELLEHIFLLSRDKNTQAALLRTSKAWAAVGSRCGPLEAEIGLSGGACWPLGKRWGGGPRRVEPEQLPSGGLPAATAWLVQQRRLAQAGAALKAVPHLAQLTVRSKYDIQWLPLLPALTSLSLQFEFEPDDYEDGGGPLDCIARAAPQLRSLYLGAHLQDEYEPAYLSTGASLPTGLTSLSLNGFAGGLGPHLSQLVRLGWHPQERREWVAFPEEAIEGLSQLTWLSLYGPHTIDIPALFDSLACLTGLRSLSIGAGDVDEPITLLNRQYYNDDEEYDFVLEELLSDALAELTALTHLSLLHQKRRHPCCRPLRTTAAAPAAMQALSHDRLVCVEQPQLLEHIFLLARDGDTQAALLRTSKAWAAVGSRCSPLEAEIGPSGGACWPLGKRWAFPRRAEPEQLPSGGLPAAAAWFAQQRRLVAKLDMRLGASRPWWGANESADEEDPATVEAQAHEVLQAVPELTSLNLRSLFDIQWLPRLPALTSLSLNIAFDPARYTGGGGPLDCIAHAAPRLRSLDFGAYSAPEYAPVFLSPGASLPTGLTGLRSDGFTGGFGPHLSQLLSLTWQPMERRSWVAFPEDMIAGLSQYYRDAEDYEFVLEELLPDALAELTGLTQLDLRGHNMPVCPESLAYLPALKHLDLCRNEGLTQLPHGPWPALESLRVDFAAIQAALNDPPAKGPAAQEAGGSADAGQGAGSAEMETEAAGHALWSLTRLTALGDLWLSGLSEEEKEETKQAIRRLLPRLVHIS
ncbi:disease resistance N [Chlorella sorokiniana]|uniref:Disease resistance N n=1 Tax=Chlorella sorokiniana TaxID=3076 RepID=A0A2P6U019_CHLSO|nr:disease resistance N [Chlorella sorokiniana]|eukprot:PRW59664.1 disease resistance N [Chlorella sorokiniana]